MEAKARIRGQQRADGRASSPGPCETRCCVQEARMALVNICGGTAARDRAGEAVRTAAVPARAVIGGTGCTAPQQAGAPGPPERTHASGGLGVSRDRRARREHSCASRPEGTSALEKTSADGGGSHRRSRAMEQWLWTHVATKTRLTHARSVRDLQRGKTSAPCPLEVVQSDIGATKHLRVSRGVLGGANGQRDSDAFATRGNHRHEARRHRTVAQGVGGTNHRSPDNDNTPRRHARLHPGTGHHSHRCRDAMHPRESCACP